VSETEREGDTWNKRLRRREREKEKNSEGEKKEREKERKRLRRFIIQLTLEVKHGST
jgi:hypothetical protein